MTGREDGYTELFWGEGMNRRSSEIQGTALGKCLQAWPVLGDSGGVVNSLEFCPASLKSLGSFYFRCILSSQWKVVTVNLRILNCQL